MLAGAVIFLPMVVWNDLLEQDQRDWQQDEHVRRKPHDSVATTILASLRHQSAHETDCTGPLWFTEEYCLFLRPFRMTGSLNVQSSTPSSLGMANNQRPLHIDIETLLAKQFEPQLRFVALGRTLEQPPTGGSARRVYLADEKWWDDLVILSNSASVIVIIPDASKQCVREASWLEAQKLLTKCIFYMPGSIRGDSNFEPEWNEAIETFQEIGISLPPYNPAGALFTLDLGGYVGRFVTTDFTRTLFRGKRLRDRLIEVGVIPPPCDHDSRGGFPNRLKSDSP